MGVPLWFLEGEMMSVEEPLDGSYSPLTERGLTNYRGVRVICMIYVQEVLSNIYRHIHYTKLGKTFWTHIIRKKLKIHRLSNY